MVLGDFYFRTSPFCCYVHFFEFSLYNSLADESGISNLCSVIVLSCFFDDE